MEIKPPELELGQVMILTTYSNEDIEEIKEKDNEILCKIIQRVYDTDTNQWLYKGKALHWVVDNYDLACNMPLCPVDNYTEAEDS